MNDIALCWKHTTYDSSDDLLVSVYGREYAWVWRSRIDYMYRYTWNRSVIGKSWCYETVQEAKDAATQLFEGMGYEVVSSERMEKLKLLL